MEEQGIGKMLMHQKKEGGEMMGENELTRGREIILRGEITLFGIVNGRRWWWMIKWDRVLRGWRWRPLKW